jgi:hypothetical protein
VDKAKVVYIPDLVLFSHKEEQNNAGKWMKLEIMLSEINQM